MKKPFVKTIIIYYNNKKYEYSIDLQKNLNDFYEEIINFLNIANKKKLISLSYKNYTLDLSLQGNLILKKIFTNDSNPTIEITTFPPKKSRDTENLDPFNSKKIINNNYQSLNKDINDIIENNNSNKLNSSFNLYVYNIPSFYETSQILDDYYKKDLQSQENNLPKAIITALDQNSNNNICISFPNEVIKNNFHKYLSYIKYENPKFKNIIINIRKNKRNLSVKQVNNSKKNSSDNYKMDMAAKILKLKNNHNNHNKNLHKKYFSYYQTNDINNELYNQLKKSGCDKIITDYYRHQNSLRNSSPYKDEEEKKILEERENKKKFISDKGFFNAVGKNSIQSNYISNYVDLTPSENPSNHKFRNVSKNKWMTNKGFI